jgi:hypothetical protein
MTCKNCGTEIADKALICYRCGQPTFEAVRKPAAISSGPRPGGLFLAVLVLLLALGGLAYGYWDTSSPRHEIAWAVAAVSGLLFAWRLRVLILQQRSARRRR